MPSGKSSVLGFDLLNSILMQTISSSVQAQINHYRFVELLATPTVRLRHDTSIDDRGRSAAFGKFAIHWTGQIQERLLLVTLSRINPWHNFVRIISILVPSNRLCSSTFMAMTADM